MSITKNVLPYCILQWKKMRMILMIFDTENWLWKSNFGSFDTSQLHQFSKFKKSLDYADFEAKICLILYPLLENSTTRTTIKPNVGGNWVTDWLLIKKILSLTNFQSFNIFCSRRNPTQKMLIEYGQESVNSLIFDSISWASPAEPSRLCPWR